MSPLMFNMFMDGVVREVYSKVNRLGVRVNEDDEREWLVSRLLFADDTSQLCLEFTYVLHVLSTVFGIYV